MKYHKQAIPILIALLVTIPGLYCRLAGVDLAPPMMAILGGAAILGAAFLVLWASDVAQMDISQTLAVALIALVAVLPEYAVDMYFTWMAGRNPEGEYAQYAIANMTGANRLLIGVAWGVIAVIFWIKTRKAVVLEAERRTEVLFLGLATVYAFVIPLKGTLAWYDGVVLIGLFAWYITIASKRPCVECIPEGPAQYIANMPQGPRRTITTLMFLYSAGTILANSEPFSEGLVGTGKVLGISEFLLVQWLAPIASEAPEFTVAIIFAMRAQAGLALGSLLSAKLNQWTLLVGMIPWVYAISSGTLAHPIPMGSYQMNEILLTAAQSLLAMVILATLRLSIGQAMLLFALFFGQFIAPVAVPYIAHLVPIALTGEQVHQLFSALYLMSAATLILDKPDRFKDLWTGFRVSPEDIGLTCEPRHILTAELADKGGRKAERGNRRERQGG
jgi:cation:H+ antiporter